MEAISNPVDQLKAEGFVSWARCPYAYQGLALKECVDVGFSIFEHGIEEVQIVHKVVVLHELTFAEECRQLLW
jgi:hypothetical protein